MGSFLSKGSSNVTTTPQSSAPVDSELTQQPPSTADAKEKDTKAEASAAAEAVVGSENDADKSNEDAAESPSTSVPDKADDPSTNADTNTKSELVAQDADGDKDSSHLVPPVNLEQQMVELTMTSAPEHAAEESNDVSAHDDGITEVSAPSGDVQQHHGGDNN